MSGTYRRPVWSPTPITYPPLVRCAAHGGLVRRWRQEPEGEPIPLVLTVAPRGMTAEELERWRLLALVLIVSSACLFWYAITR